MARSRSPASALAAFFVLAGAFAFLSLRPSDASAPLAAGRAYKKVTRVIRGTTDSVAYVTFGSPSSLGRDETIRCTPNHPFYVRGEGWVGAGDLQPGDALVGSRDEPVVVRGAEVRAEHAETYNLEVEDFHTYFVAASQDGPAVWVHNDCLRNAATAKVDMRKLTEYALDPEHPVGRNKARVFESALGITKEHAASLVEQIKKGLLSADAVPGKVDQFGVRFTVDVPVVGPKGEGIVRTGWIFKPGSEVPELTTLFVR